MLFNRTMDKELLVVIEQKQICKNCLIRRHSSVHSEHKVMARLENQDIKTSQRCAKDVSRRRRSIAVAVSVKVGRHYQLLEVENYQSYYVLAS